MWVSWRPDTAKGKDKMIHACCNETLSSQLIGLSRKIGATDAGELSEEWIQELVKSKV